MEEINKLKKKRTSVRKMFTKAYNETKRLTEECEVTTNVVLLEIKGMLLTLEQYSNSLLELDDEILELMLNKDVSEDELDSEYESRAQYLKNWNTVKAQCESIFALSLKREGSVNGESVVDRPMRHLHLPKLELPSFDGNVKGWIGFWGQFKKVHDNEDIEPQDKFQYLFQSMALGSIARELVASFPPSGENYFKAIDHLKARFGRDEFLIEVYVRELLHLVLQQATNKTKMSLSSLFDKLETQLRALETLGVTSEKYASMLFPLVESALPDDILRVWERHRVSAKVNMAGSTVDLSSPLVSDNKINYLQMLLDFLRTEVESEERLCLARSSFVSGTYRSERMCSLSQGKSKWNRSQENNSKVSTASAIVTTESKPKVSGCLFCKKEGHNTQDCLGFHACSMEEKRDFIVKNNTCFLCLKQGHCSKKCKVFVCCFFCNKKKHYAVMCPDLEKYKKTKSQPSNVVAQDLSVEKSETLLTNQGKETLMQTLMVKVVTSNRSLVVRALLDSGSQKSYITKDIAKSLSLIKTGEDVVIHSLFGGVETTAAVHNLYEIGLTDLHNTNKLSINVLDQYKICNYVPRLSSNKYFPVLKKKNIILSDVGETIPDIKLLLGADVLGKILTGNVVRLDEWLIAVETRLGWTVMGQCQSVTSNSMSTISCFVKADIPDLWQLDILGIKDPAEVKSRNILQDEAKNHFNNTVTVNSENRYEVSLPWLEGHPELQDNRQLAEKRLISVTKRLFSISKFGAYDDIFREWLNCGIIERVTETLNSDKVHYLPHHAVLKESSLTTKVRPVFDASAADKNGNSLNSCLEKGPNLVEQIPALLMKFRLEAVGVVADIKKAFLQISVNQKDRDFMRFLWWEDYSSRKLMEFRHCRVVFGVSPSPFLLGATLLYHLNRSPKEFKDTAEKLKSSFYVDNCIASVSNEAELNKFVTESQELLNSAKFELRAWASNVPLSKEVLQKSDDVHFSQTNIVPVLGMLWDLKDDTLCCNISTIQVACSPVTKRSLLSVAHRVFDPIGFTCPFTLTPKFLLQRVWKLKLRWDDELPCDILNEFNKWVEEVHCLKDLKIRRHFGDCKRKAISLHTFSDASKRSYAACVFIRIEDEDKVAVQLVGAKSRLAPMKEISIPRLELVAAVIGTRLHSQVVSNIHIEGCKSYFWTDSTVVLAWLKTKGNWKTFVGNRCKEICENTDPESWNHVPGPQNPADLPSRGCNGKVLIASKWWEGPDWLRKSEDEWPKMKEDYPEEEVNSERNKSVITSILIDAPKISNDFCHFGGYTKNVRIMGWVLRFYQNLKEPNDHKIGDLSSEELKKAEVALLKIVQKESLKSHSVSKKLTIFTGKEGLIRIKSKLTYNDEDCYFKCPILLPSESKIIQMLILEKHINNSHAGVQTLTAILRETFWILKCRSVVKKVVSRCIICKRHRVKPFQTPFAPLPQDRIRDSKVFETTGIDLAGPLFLKEGKKAYIVLFTCAVYRAIHLEIVLSLSTDSFLNALRRFIARRGRVSTIYTDNGTNFVGSSNLLKRLDWKKVEYETSVQRILWKFNPPSAAWWGGWWERLVGLVKQLLRRNLGRSSVTYEELLTILCDCEATLNARPLTYLSNDDDFLQPLTPSLFLQPLSCSDVPDIDDINSTSINKRVRYLQKLRKSLRERFQKEYLAMLVHKGKNPKCPDICIGDIVLLGDDNVKRIKWPLAVVLELFPGKDGNLRVAKVKTSSGEFIRPLQRLYPLEIKSVVKEVISENVEKMVNKDQSSHNRLNKRMKTRSGRMVKEVKKLTLFSL